MSETIKSNIADWLQVKACEEDGLYELTFAEHHLGNIWIRSLHGGVSGATIELAAEAETRKAVADERAEVSVVSSSIDYLRITRDANLIAKASIVRLSRRLCVVDVVCWQDAQDNPVVRGTITLKVDRPA